MFYSLTGNIINTDETSVAIDCGGVGYLCYSTLNTLKRIGSIGDRVTVYTYLNVREDAMELYGFMEKKELDCFKLLISVSGVGPKAALAILSQHTPESLASSIAMGDAKAITRAQGVGPKIAQRVVLELKGKMDINLEEVTLGDVSNAPVQTEGNVAEAVSALVALGYSRNEAAAAFKGVDSSLSTEDLIKHALKKLAF